jgi:DNA-binding NtrC family response regulator
VPGSSPQETLRGGNETVLLVEDEESVRELLVEVLRMSGYRVMEAAHGREAVRLSRKYPDEIQLLVTDVVMPHMGGREAAERICRARSETRVLIMSGYLHHGTVPKEVGDRECRFIEKPFTPYDFSIAVRAALDTPTIPIRPESEVVEPLALPK